MEQNKKVLILGSGMMVEPLIDYLMKRSDNSITLASNDIKHADYIIKKHSKQGIKAVEIDVIKDKTKLLNLIKDSDLVISYIPPFLHEHIAKICLELGKNMLTTSYVGDYMKKISEDVKKKGLIFMNEIGLDPGIDHIITYKVLQEAKSRGDKILSYKSWCGALCSPEFVDNPLLLKFSWSPLGVLLALRNDAIQYINNKVVKIPSNEILIQITNDKFHPCFSFEGYYNRDSLHYKDHYKLEDAHTVVRGTIRYFGFSFIFQCFKNLTLFNKDKVESKVDNWKNYFTSFLINDERLMERIKILKAKYFKTKKDLLEQTNIVSLIDEKEGKFYCDLSLAALVEFDEVYINKFGFFYLFNKIFLALKFLDFYNTNNKVLYFNLLDQT